MALREIKLWHLFFLVAFFSFPCFAEEFDDTVSPPVALELPQDLVNVLNQKYNGFRVAGKEDYCEGFDKQVLPFAAGKRWSYGAIDGDFNGDRLHDYTLIIQHKKKYIWLVAIKNNPSKIPPYLLKELGEPVIRSERIPDKFEKMGSKICSGALKATRTEEGFSFVDVPYDFVALENDASAIVYYWKNGQWHETDYAP